MNDNICLRKNKIKSKRGEAYIDTIITVFLCLVIIAVSIGLFQTMYEYQKVSDIADNALEYASVVGKIPNENEVSQKLDNLIASNGFNPDDVTYSFNSSELIEEGGISTEKVQYGNTISMTIETKIKIGFTNLDGYLTIPIKISKSVVSQKYWK